ncbi:MAG TPA: ABC transporter substrate-binding protein [Conexibacter sp.]|nr:ABC transporter substrate-binding protein [Conexibacter sp.]
MRHWLWRAGALVAIAATVTACGSSSTGGGTQTQAQGHRGGTLVGEATDGPDSLDPAQANINLSQAFLRMTNDGLTALQKADGKAGTTLVADLATTLPTPTDGGRTYVFQLRKGIRYSTGAPVRASDVRFSLERLWKSGSPDIFFRGTGSIVGSAACDKQPTSCDLSKGIVADDAAGTVTFHLTAPQSDFLLRLASTFASVLPPSTAVKPPATEPLPSTGPYVLASFVPHRQVTWVRNPKFRQWSAQAQPDGSPDKIVLRLGVTGEAIATDLEHGSADFYGNDSLPADRLGELATRYAKQVRVVPTPATYWFDLNTAIPPFSDPNVRRALNFATDRAAIVKLWGGPAAAHASCQILPPNFPAYEEYCPYTANPAPDGNGPWSAPDMAQARALIAKSRFRGTSVKVWAEQADPQRQVALYMVGLLNQLGFKASVKTLSTSAYYGYIDNSSHKIQADFSGWTGSYPAASNFMVTNFKCSAFIPNDPGSYNLGEYCDHGVDAQMAQAQKLELTDQQAANALWTKIDREITDAAPFVIAFNPNNIVVSSSRVARTVYSSAGYSLWYLWQLR